MFRRAVILVAIVLVAMAALAPAAFGESAIRVWKWNDLNANGIWEGEGTGEGEPGLVGWVMTFYSRASANDPWVQVAQRTTGRLITIGGSGPVYLPGFTWLSVPSGFDYKIVESPPLGEEDLWAQSFPGYGPTGSVPTIFTAVADGATYVARFGDYRITYTWSGLEQPVAADGSSIFKRVRGCVPLKFQVFDTNGDWVSHLQPTLTLSKLSAGIWGDEFAPSSGNVFRYDAASGRYVYNLSTKGMTAGTYRLTIDLGGGDRRFGQFSLQ